MSDLGTVLLSVVLALFSGGGAVWWIETIWRPARERQRVALILLRELAMNRRSLKHLQPNVYIMPNSAVIPVDHTISRVGLESTGLKLSELPPEVVSDVIGVYKYFNHLDRVFDSYQRCSAELATMAHHCTPRAREVIIGMRGAVEQFSKSLAEAIRYCDVTMEQLGTMADDPDWEKWLEERAALAE